MGGGSGDTTTVQKSDPWSGVQPALKSYYDALGQWFYGSPATSAQNIAAKYGEKDTGYIMDIYNALKDTDLSKYSRSNIGKLPYYHKVLYDKSDKGAGAFFWDQVNRNRISSYDQLKQIVELGRQLEAGQAETGQAGVVPSWQQMPMVAPQSPLTTLAQNLMTERALSGGGIMNQAQQAISQGLYGYNPAISYLTPTASGAMMDQDFNRFYNQAAQRVGEQFQNITMPAIASRYSLAGRTGSGSERQAYEGAMGQLGQTLGGLATDIYGQERGRQMQAAQSLGDLYGQQARERLQYSLAAPQYAYADIAPLFDIGQQQQAYQQSLIDAPLRRLQAVAPMLQPGLGFGTQTTTMPTYSNPAMGAMGGAAMGYGLLGGSTTAAGTALGPYGALAGAILGYMAQQ